ncbi:hypothetical protein GCM10010911_39390 [Paenibacillus nasutitermitis]|uniref:Excalibur calcium-binding domain-containing protein n=1 Tax=Paenibacillus nasutitermitis TaxID=1652958 RepID=A0A916Z6D8_9BACL|nr:excalibur calcium-binding domain-containing protein [Paenibacillus nasutitermitis]GGD77488.1 hypothetical protein GCM10010911_39390 [Paenibacillus nasutitermitis]
MRRLTAIVTASVLVSVLTFGAAGTAEAKTTVKTFKNCSEMNKVYKGGVARTSSAKNKGGKTKLKPFVSKELYDANKKSDRDHDLIACER